jgi:hypothetical protein
VTDRRSRAVLAEAVRRLSGVKLISNTVSLPASVFVHRSEKWSRSTRVMDMNRMCGAFRSCKLVVPT